MKIFMLPVPDKLQPGANGFRYPAHNKDYGVEQDFLLWLLNNPQNITHDAAEADWHYLPVFWTRWHINHHFAEDGEGLQELGNAVEQVILDPIRTFTISQFDGGTLLNVAGMLVFTAARTTNPGIDIPILCSPHKRPFFKLRKKYLASFNGTFETHPVRTEMRNAFSGRADICIGGNLPTRFFKRWLLGKQFNLNTLSSYTALCPRGTSCNSFRFFEAMQLGVAPCLIGDHDVRPFKKFIDWDSMSYYVRTVPELEELLATIDKEEAIRKGKMARKYWEDELFYSKWCKYVLKELGDYRG